MRTPRSNQEIVERSQSASTRAGGRCGRRKQSRDSRKGADVVLEEVYVDGLAKQSRDSRKWHGSLEKVDEETKKEWGSNQEIVEREGDGRCRDDDRRLLEAIKR